MPTDVLLAAVLFGALVAYVLFAGADFGGGVWDLLAWGPRRHRQRAAIAAAIGPIWEANHVWLILAVVVLFAGFPTAFAAVGTALHVPLTLFLLGVVFRGSAFVFRGSGGADDRGQRRWGLVFSLASVLSPVLLGACVGALASGRIRVVEGRVVTDFFTAWLSPFPMALGALSLALSAYLAATYLAAEVLESDLQDDFRRRALGAGVAVGATALLALLLASGAPPVGRGLLSVRALPLHAAAGAAAVAAFWLLARRHHRLARLVVPIHVALILAGWAATQYPYLVYPDVTIAGAAVSPRTRALLLGTLLAGLPVLAPSLWILFRVFKARAAQSSTRST